MQELERQELEIQFLSNSGLEAEVCRLEDQIANGVDSEDVPDELNCLLTEALVKIDLAKMVIFRCSQVTTLRLFAANFIFVVLKIVMCVGTCN